MAGVIIVDAKRLFAPKSIDLSAKGVIAWRKWALSTDTSGGAASTSSFNGSKLSDLTAITGAKTKTGGGPASATWNNGTPAANGSADISSAIMAAGLNNGMSFTAEADANMRTLKYLVMPYGGQVTITVSLGDSSASPVATTIAWRPGGKPFLFRVHYKANGATTLTVLMNQDEAAGNIIAACAVLYGAVVQESFRQFSDNGSETTHTPLAAQGADISVTPGTVIRPRIILANGPLLAAPQTYKIGARAQAEPDAALLPLAVAATGRKIPTLFNMVKTPFTAPESAPAQAGPWATITPPSGMVIGQFVRVLVNTRDNQTLGVHGTNNGGQTWSSSSQVDQTSDHARLFWCIFNGAWTGTLQFGNASITDAITATMTVWNDVDQTTPHDVAPVGATYAAAASPSVATFNTTTDNAAVIVDFTSADDNDWGSQTAGFESADGSIGTRNSQGSDNSQYTIYKPQTTAGAVGSVSATQTARGNDAGTIWYSALKGAAITYPEYMTPSSYVTDGEPTTPQLLKA